LNQILRILLRRLLLRGIAALFGRAHLLRRLLQVACGLLHLRIVLLSGLLFELPRQFFQIAPELLNIALVVLRILVLRALLPLQFCLLASRQFFQFVGRFLLLGRLLLLTFTALNGFVLVRALIEFEFEQVGKIFGILLAAATAAFVRCSAIGPMRSTALLMFSVSSLIIVSVVESWRAARRPTSVLAASATFAWLSAIAFKLSVHSLGL
jgi:hypothetical protein